MVIARDRKELVTGWGDVSKLSGGGGVRVVPCFGDSEDVRIM